MNTRPLAAFCLCAVLLLSTGALAIAADAPAAKPAAAAPAPAPKGVTYDQAVSVTAEVTALDLAKRQVTVRGPQGNSVTLEVGDEVRNLPQVKVGDMVVVKYYESIALEMKQGKADTAVTTSAVAGRAEAGQKPAGAGAAQVEADVTVTAIDAKNMIVSVQGPAGNVFDVKARDPKRVAALKVGDVIHVTYTRALAIAVDPAPAK